MSSNFQLDTKRTRTSSSDSESGNKPLQKQSRMSLDKEHLPPTYEGNVNPHIIDNNTLFKEIKTLQQNMYELKSEQIQMNHLNLLLMGYETWYKIVLTTLTSGLMN